MTHKAEDEVDWSDGTLDDPPSTSTGASGDSGYVSSAVQEDDGLDYLFEPQEEGEYDVPRRTALPPAPGHPTLTRAQRAHIGVRLNRHQPSEQGYAHFDLYQANQKAYEATFLKQFVNHALHPSQIERCFQDGANAYSNMQKYIASVSANINGVMNKMTWNAHCRAVNLLANASKDGAPFWDIGSFDRNIFAEFDPNNTALVAHKTNESAEIVSAAAEPRILSDLRKFQDSGRHDKSSQPVSAETPQPSIEMPPPGFPQLERLFEEFGEDALSGHHHTKDIVPSQEQIDPVPTWPTRLLNDHKRRLIQKSPQVSRRALPGIRAVIAEAISQGFRPTDPDLQGLIVDIESREQSEAAPVQMSEEVSVAEDSQKVVSKTQESNHGKIRNREQHAPIRMFNKPIEPSRKKRKVDATTLSITGPSRSTEKPTRTHKLNLSISSFSRLQLKQNKSKPLKQKISQHAAAFPIDPEPLPPHPSGSKTLEPHQQLPPGAYFEPNSPSEKLVWPCDINHAMGHYYNAGDRKNCPGCFTAFSDNINAKVMDFYLPSRTHFHQPNPTRWRPSKPFGRFGRARRSAHLSHNSIAKEAYWPAIIAGANDDDARQTAVDAVIEQLKPKPRKEPTPEPTPSPPPDLGPHLSNSSTMEHGQDLPLCAYFSARSYHEEFAWRCDINHALGRYYLAGDKRTCPGCGSNKSELGKHTEMDFYMPLGVMVRQEVRMAKWKARKPYKMREGDKGRGEGKSVSPSHNQIASKKYWEAIDAGKTQENALSFAIEETDSYFDEKEDEAARKMEKRNKAEETKSEKALRKFDARTSRKQPTTADSEQSDDDEGAGYIISYGRNANHEDLSDEEMDHAEAYEIEHEMNGASLVEDVVETSSDDETSSVSDSE
ncbi:hypothetical protein BU25DRAFT_453319 [Macroventuria anomochaeta]|uniref:Uncharacterized protein n=1 Tax=Macroventuria anomochaeta TaxID=301207 RepID=A0ACB6SHY4_9PLEO|nr:uncharacterized protein BU25DRAFT_453319 [Macroventuria anomochaeta]KAF2633572.1 hypothetical protein BU25DRAFT_453319 [Macroventuria anomochaeta]